MILITSLFFVSSKISTTINIIFPSNDTLCPHSVTDGGGGNGQLFVYYYYIIVIIARQLDIIKSLNYYLDRLFYFL